jgi:hypothetical protein
VYRLNGTKTLEIAIIEGLYLVVWYSVGKKRKG